MKTFTIRRTITGNSGTFGTFIHNSIPFALTLEREWLDNKPSLGDIPGSCIPAGVYVCERVQSPRFGETFMVMDVPNRSHILFHKGNLDDDSRGCILVGEKYGDVHGQHGIQASKDGYNEFMNKLKGEDDFRLIIVDDWKHDLTEEFDE